MSDWTLFYCLSFSLMTICDCQTFTERFFYVYYGIKLDLYYKSVQFRYNSTLKCASLCLDDKSCLAASYNPETYTCELNEKTPYDTTSVVRDEPSWKVLSTNGETWELVFRGNSGASHQIYPSYLGTEVLPEPEVGCLLPPSHNLTCNTNYRSSIFDSWTNQGISEVMVHLYKDKSVVVNMTFNNPSNGSLTDWFGISHLTYSTYTDMMDTGQTFNFFAIIGDTDPGIDRRFYINKAYGGCPVDLGWICIFDSSVVCPYETDLTQPAITYMPNNIIGTWDTKRDSFFYIPLPQFPLTTSISTSLEAILICSA